MKLIYFIAVILSVCSCKSVSSQKKKDIVDAIGLTSKWQDSNFLLTTPDSISNWLPYFDSLLYRDQKFRTNLSTYNTNRLEQEKLDFENQSFLMAFIKKFGYPTSNQIGIGRHKTVGTVIQHSPVEMQEKFYPAIKQAYLKNQVTGEAFAMLEDRINVKRSRFQVYGTQLLQEGNQIIVYPIANVDSLDILRAKMGILLPMKDYLRRFNLFWDATQYKNEILPGLIKRYKIKSDSILRAYEFPKE